MFDIAKILTGKEAQNYHHNIRSHLEHIVLLRRVHRKRKSKGIGRKTRKTKVANRISIEQPPLPVETRQQAGHQEGDSLVFKKKPLCAQIPGRTQE